MAIYSKDIIKEINVFKETKKLELPINMEFLDESLQIKRYTIDSRTSQLTVCPRNFISHPITSDALQQNGCYVLIGPLTDDDKGAYVGKTDNIKNRSTNHDASKEFWNEILIFTSKYNCFNSVLISSFEYLIERTITEADFYQSMNSNKIPIDAIANKDKKIILDYFSEFRTLLAAADKPIFGDDNIINTTIFTSTRRSSGIDIIARAQYKNGLGEFVILRGSMGIENERIKELVEKGIVKKENSYYRFIQDYRVKNPSTANHFIFGYQAGGYDIWKDEHARTLKEYLKTD